MKQSLISFVIPVYNEADSLVPLSEEIAGVMKALHRSYECLFINDGSTDATQQQIEALYTKDPAHIRCIQFRKNFGKASAYHAGFQQAKGEIIITMDADLQDDPVEIPRFIAQIENGYDLVCGWKKQRLDGWVKNSSSRVFNWMTNRISHTQLHDYNCGYKAYRGTVAKEITVYGELHRYIPVLAAARGYTITEIAVHHRKRQYGETKYNGLRFIHGFLDLCTVLFLTRFRERPLHLFGYLGMGFFNIGFVLALYLTWVKLVGHQAIGERPLLLFSVMLMIMGVQIGVTGLVGEQITTLIHKNETDYMIKSTLE